LHSIHAEQIQTLALQPTLHRTRLAAPVAERCGSWLELTSAGKFYHQGHHCTPKLFVCRAFEKHLKWSAGEF
jgi:hypothetical protein